MEGFQIIIFNQTPIRPIVNQLKTMILEGFQELGTFKEMIERNK